MNLTNRYPSLKNKVVFITGVGEIFPIVRSHNVLNNLQRAAKHTPTLMFFPGAYTQSDHTGASLDLFGRLHDDTLGFGQRAASRQEAPAQVGDR